MVWVLDVLCIALWAQAGEGGVAATAAFGAVIVGVITFSSIVK
jgi:hypothetical protein